PDSVDRRLVAPACYCLRHGLELLLKFIRAGAGLAFLQSHDQVALAKSAVSVDMTNDQVGLLAELSALEAEELRAAIPAHFGHKISVLIAKYDSLDDSSKKDKANDFLRYPTPSADRWIKSLDSSEIIELRVDAQEALSLVLMFLGTLQQSTKEALGR